MLSILSLWLPVLLSAVGVFIASSLIHMVLQWHAREYRRFPNEAEMRAVVGRAQLAPGQYTMPFCPTGKELPREEMHQQFREGPVATLIVRANGLPNMGVALGQWFALTLVVALLSASLAAMVLGAGTDGHKVFHFFAVLTFMVYATGSAINAIWMGKLWSAVAVDLLDSLLYALITGAVFAWLWPQ